MYKQALEYYLGDHDDALVYDADEDPVDDNVTINLVNMTAERTATFLFSKVPVVELDNTSVEPTEEAEIAPPEGAQPEAAPPAKPGKKKNKKDIIKEALAESPGGITADDIVTKMIEAGLSSEAKSDKDRHYVIMSISHLRRAGKKIALREGKYVLEGDQDE